jgi:hypothetical protein
VVFHVKRITDCMHNSICDWYFEMHMKQFPGNSKYSEIFDVVSLECSYIQLVTSAFGIVTTGTAGSVSIPATALVKLEGRSTETWIQISFRTGNNVVTCIARQQRDKHLLA